MLPLCSDPPILALSICRRSADSTDSPAGEFDTAEAGCPDESKNRRSSAFALVLVLLLLFKEPSAGVEDKDNKFRNNSALIALFTCSDDEDEFASDRWETLPRP